MTKKAENTNTPLQPSLDIAGVRRSLSFRHRFGNTIQFIIGIIENLIMIFTFSSILPKWSMKFIIFRMTKGKRWLWG